MLIYGSPEFAAKTCIGAIMPSPSAAEMKVTWNYGHRGGLSDDSIEVWIGDERIARFAGTKEAMDYLALALLELRTTSTYHEGYKAGWTARDNEGGFKR